MTKLARSGRALLVGSALVFLAAAAVTANAQTTVDCSKFQGAPAGAGEVRATCVQADVLVHRAGAPAASWQPLAVDTVLGAGDEISSDPDGAAVLAFADSSTVTIRNVTQLKILSFDSAGKTDLLLKAGEVAAKVNGPATPASGFRIKTTTATASAQGASFSMLYDQIAKASVVSVAVGVVSVDPTKGGLATVSVGAGKEVEVLPAKLSPLAAIGHAGVPAGAVSLSRARQIVTTQLAKNDELCKIKVGIFGLLPAAKGWTVSAKVSGGKSGWAVWKVKGSVASASNPIAKAIAGGCR